MAVRINTGAAQLEVLLGLPPEHKELCFAHGSGSGRFSLRNNFVARVLQESGIATLLADLLEERESSDRKKAFDIDPLAERARSLLWGQVTPPSFDQRFPSLV